MAISGIDHVNIRTLDIVGTVRFYTEVLGLTYDGPTQVDGFVRHWLRDVTGRPILHLRELAPAVGSTGAIDHVALICDHKTAMLERMTSVGVVYAARDNHTDRITQVFVTDPNGVALELSFPFGSVDN